MRICIVEDEPIIAEDIKMSLMHLGHEVLEYWFEAEECLKALKVLKPDLLLLDIDLGKNEMDGISLANIINSEFKIPFIFLTAFYDDDTIRRASITKPAAYLVKPFEKKDLKVAIGMVSMKYKNERDQNSNLKNDSFRLFVKDGKGFMNPVSSDEILFFNANDNYCYIQTDASKHIVLHRLKDFVEKYNNAGFQQIHRSYVINLKHISQISEDHVFINCHKIPIGKSFKKSFFSKLEIV